MSVTKEDILKREKIEAYDWLKIEFQYWYRQQCKNKMKFTDEQKKKLKMIFHYMIRSEYGELDNSAGLFISGPYGSGKTTIFESLLKSCGKPNISIRYIGTPECLRRGFHQVRYTEIVEALRNTGSTTSFTKYNNENLLIDDFMYQGKKEVKSYGEKIEIADLIITTRYEVRNKVTTYFTNNFSAGQVYNEIGEAGYSRLAEMCNLIKWDGPNHRLKYLQEF